MYSVNRRGLRAQPWGSPVLSTNVVEVWLPICTPWGLLVRESSIQFEIVVLKPKLSNQLHGCDYVER